MRDSLSRKLSRRQVLAGMGMASAGAILAACGTDSDTPPGAPAAPGASGSDTTPASEDVTDAVADPSPTALTDVTDAPATGNGEVVTLRFMRFAGPAWIHDTRFVDEFMEENPNIIVEAEDVIYAEMFTKSQTLGATDSLADVFSGHSRWTPYLGHSGMLLKLDDLVEEHHDEIEFDDFFPSVIADARTHTDDDGLYWLPTVVHSGGNAVILFNMNKMEEAGVDLPTDPDWTLDDYAEIVREVGDPGNNLYGTWVNVRTTLYAQQFLRSWGTDPERGSDDAWLLAPDGVTFQSDSDAIREGMEWFAQFVREGLAPTEADRASLEDTGVDHFVAEQAVTRASEVGGPQTNRDRVEGRFEIGAWIIPRGPHGHRGSALSYNNQAIWSKTQHPEEAFQLVHKLTGPEIAFWAGYDGNLQCMARRSAWFNELLWEKHPHMKQVAEWFDTWVDPFPMPDNLRFVEWQEVWENETFEYLNGNETWESMQPRLQERCQNVLNQPRP